MNGSNDNAVTGAGRRMNQGIDVVSEPSAHQANKAAPLPVNPDRDKRIGEDNMD